jgi:hypothetical protein
LEPLNGARLLLTIPCKDADMHDAGDIPMHDEPPLIPAEFQPRMQMLLGTLADIDFAHECEINEVNSAAMDPSFKTQMVTKLGQVHQQRRHPYAEELIRLQDWMRFRLLRETVEGD